MENKTNETIMMAELKAEYQRKSNEIARRKQQLEIDKAQFLNEADERYHATKRDLLAKIADIRLQKVGLDKEDPKRYELADEIRNTEDLLSLERDKRDMEARQICHQFHAERDALDDEHRELGEWYDGEVIRIKKEIMAAKEAERQAAAEEGGEQ